MKKDIPLLLIIFAALSFIPLIGVLFGIISIIISLYDFKRLKLISILGISGISLTIILYFGIVLFTKSNIWNEGKKRITESALNNIILELDIYKCKYNKYPDSLEELKRVNNKLIINEIYPSIINKHRKKFYYKSNCDTFELFSVGKDGKPFTNR